MDSFPSSFNYNLEVSNGYTVQEVYELDDSIDNSIQTSNEASPSITIEPENILASWSSI